MTDTRVNLYSTMFVKIIITFIISDDILLKFALIFEKFNLLTISYYFSIFLSFFKLILFK